MIVVVDYGMGNLRSVYKKLKQLGVPADISSDKTVIGKADKLILPGVGHFASGIKRLHETGLTEILHRRVMNDRIPVLGICLGMQLMTQFSEEGNVPGLGWVNARVIRFRIEEKDKFIYKVPHMGWNNVVLNRESVLFRQIDPQAEFYFVHSYHVPEIDSSFVAGTTVYACPFVSYFEKDNLFGAQFHPEKSQEAGMQFFLNFINL
mgnify:CR=1 FL=1